MIKVQFEFDIPEDRMQAFLKHVPTLKKTWESLGCKSYSAYRSINQRLRKDQIIEKNRITEDIMFESLDDINKFFAVAKADSKFRAMAESYEKLFGATDIKSRILESV
jgi:hypothetical protein